MSAIQNYREQIKSALSLTDDEFQGYATDGGLKLFADALSPGYTPILTGVDGVIAANGYVRFRHHAYSDELALVRSERAAGRENFPHILYQLRTQPPGNSKKLASMGLRNLYGHDVIAHPFMGQLIEMRTDMCVPFHHFVMQHVLKSKLTADTDAVFEIGMGIGDALTDFALRNPWPHIEFFGGEIALNGLKCLKEFSEMLGLKNVRGVEFNCEKPDVSFLKGKKKALVFSQFTLVYLKPFPERMFLDLLEVVDEVTAVFFEPFSFALTPRLGNKPIFDHGRAMAYGINDGFWAGLESLQARGKIVIEDVVPDFIGKALLSTVSLVVFRKK